MSALPDGLHGGDAAAGGEAQPPLLEQAEGLGRGGGGQRNEMLKFSICKTGFCLCVGLDVIAKTW